ncbi:hypothetical protein UFOVP1290_147 [uncultured Caudovirales phage]|uniref:Uncharacterized protein n=1 Tax=uncultured Caudovirales phage TaxID=2100421 RepID=A0A6J5RQS3_9CAUD|nr:hypothetical protein UFOVP1290_147 [uncultured Caudovirales phage]
MACWIIAPWRYAHNSWQGIVTFTSLPVNKSLPVTRYPASVAMTLHLRSAYCMIASVVGWERLTLRKRLLPSPPLRLLPTLIVGLRYRMGTRQGALVRKGVWHERIAYCRIRAIRLDAPFRARLDIGIFVFGTKIGYCKTYANSKHKTEWRGTSPAIPRRSFVLEHAEGAAPTASPGKIRAECSLCHGIGELEKLCLAGIAPDGKICHHWHGHILTAVESSQAPNVIRSRFLGIVEVAGHAGTQLALILSLPRNDPLEDRFLV